MTSPTSHLKSNVWKLAQPAVRAVGAIGANQRVLPDFMIIGAQRCGTTSLHEWLDSNPGVQFPRFGKGVHYFDTAAHRNLKWYRTHFPTVRSVERSAKKANIARIRVGEASPYYLFHPAVPARVRAAVPDVQAIAILRDPIKRAWSHYLHERRRGYEDLSFSDALESESDRLATVLPSNLERTSYASFEHQHHSYVARGYYSTQVQRWFDAIGREQVCVIFDHELYSGDGRQRIVDYLGLSGFENRSFPRVNATTTEVMPEACRKRLQASFVGERERISDLVGRDPGWFA